jgi:hypothetical protein
LHRRRGRRGGGETKVIKEEKHHIFITMDTKDETILNELENLIKQRASDKSEMSWDDVFYSLLEFSLNDYIDPLQYYSRETLVFAAKNYFTQKKIAFNDFLQINQSEKLMHIRNIKMLDKIPVKKLKFVFTETTNYVVSEKIKQAKAPIFEDSKHLCGPLYFPKDDQIKIKPNLKTKKESVKPSKNNAFSQKTKRSSLVVGGTKKSSKRKTKKAFKMRK